MVNAASQAGLEPSRSEPPAIGVRTEGRPYALSVWDMNPNEPNPVPVDGFDLLWSQQPHAVLAEDGTLTIRWKTYEPTPGGVIYLGVRVEEDMLAPPRHRKHKSESLEGRAVEHEVSYPLHKLLRASYDVNGIAERGWGEVAWRVEAFHPGHGTTRIFDGRTAFALDSESEQPRFLHLPAVSLGPYVEQVGEDHALVWFETDVPTVAAVAAGALQPVVSATPAMRHEVLVKGLDAGRSHLYQVAVHDGAHASLTPLRMFETRDPGAPVTVAISSDSRSGVGPGLESYGGVNAAALQALFTHEVRAGAEAVFFPGDLIDGYTTDPGDYEHELRQWLRATDAVHGRIPLYTGMGNHEALVDAWSDRGEIDKEGPDSAEQRFADVLVNPTNGPEPEREGAPTYSENVYSVDMGNAHFVMLNTNYWFSNEPDTDRFGDRGNREGNLMEGQLQWLEGDLKAARARGMDHIVVMGHEPAFPAGGHKQDGMWYLGKIPEMNTMRERFWTLLAEQNVLAYVSGDEHNYSRTWIGPDVVEGAPRGVWSIISGGTGAPYYAQDTPDAYAEHVKAFSSQQHYTLWTFDGPKVRLQVIGITGDVIEDLTLTE